ncbi:SPATS2 isoform 12 [Pan troglodytes]|uniref:SPATS2 isoform 12 n=1 Tax=Pan troglodytes TaxID=9598 RepID=A0A2J8LPV8_PANTR|nr:SPATS2 isoform 12 [Pan troglodytes]
MSRKQNQKDSSGFIFDLQSNTVLAQGGAFENMKEKAGVQWRDLSSLHTSASWVQVILLPQPPM